MKKYISSSSNQLIKDLLKLKGSKDKFLIEGKDLLDLAYSNNLLDMVITSEDNDEFNNVDKNFGACIVIKSMVVRSILF